MSALCFAPCATSQLALPHPQRTRAQRLRGGKVSRPAASRHSRVVVKAIAEPEGPDSSSSPTSVQASITSFFQRYDFVSAGMGSLMVTTFCVSRGQDPFTALSITAASTVAALVIQELLFDSKSS